MMPQSAREPIITRSKDRSKKQEAQQAVVGEKHKTNRRSPEPKRTKTEKRASRKEVANNSNRKVESSSTGVESAVKPEEEPKLPNNILERGIVYFFIRGRVGIDKPSSVNEISRTHILLRPIANDAKLGKRPVADAGNTRLLALPRKVLPRSGKDRFMTFVEKSEASFKTIQDTFLEGSEYVTKTAGTRHDPPAIPVGEGVYAITTTGRESHLAYMLTLPEKLNEVQKELGLREKGSFIISTKNPTYEGPANVKFRNKPAFSKTIMHEFRSLRWVPSQPAHLDYTNAQLLLIGEPSGTENATRKQEDEKEDPEEVLEKLEEDDLKRMRHLPGGQSASIYSDLNIYANDHPKIQTTFD